VGDVPADDDAVTPADAARAHVAGRDRVLWPLLGARLSGLAQARGMQPTVLDCGGGSGRLAVPLAMAGARVVVLDISADALATLHRRADEAGVADRVSGVQGDVEDLGVRDVAADHPAAARFDMVLAHGVLDETDAPPAVLQRMAAAVAPGGALSVVADNPVAVVLGRALTGDVAGALELLLADPGPGGAGPSASARTASAAGIRRADARRGLSLPELIQGCLAAGLRVEQTQGLDVLGHLLPGALLEEAHGGVEALARFEQAAASVEPYRSIAARLHLLAGRDGPGAAAARAPAAG
jgi:S-adenosylmethionine-dependent methyltransferase